LYIAWSGEGLSLRQPLLLPPVLLARNCNIQSFPSQTLWRLGGCTDGYKPKGEERLENR